MEKIFAERADSIIMWMFITQIRLSLVHDICCAPENKYDRELIEWK